MADYDLVFSDGIVRLYRGDALEVLPALAAAGDPVVAADDAVMVADPPYGIEFTMTAPGAQGFPSLAGNDSTDAASWCIDFWHPRPALVFGANHFPHVLPERGKWSCWDKRCSESADRMFGSPFELMWLNDAASVGYSKMYRIQHGGVVNADGRGVRRVHPTQKPVVLLERVIDHLPAGGVVDPFAGSGSTLLAARRLGRPCVGVEIDEGYCEAAASRLRDLTLGLGWEV